MIKSRFSKNEPLSLSLVKLILVATIITSIGMALLIGTTGYLLTKPKIEPVVSGPMVTPTPKPTDETLDSSSNLSAEDLSKEEALATEDWKTYRNEGYGFEFKYPYDWRQSEEELNWLGQMKVPYDPYSLIALKPSELHEDFLVSILCKAGVSYEDVINHFPNPNHKITILKDIQFKGRNGKIISDFNIYAQKESRSIIVETSGNNKCRLFQPTLENNDYPFDHKYNLIIEKILSTFKLIETDETADWQTYNAPEFSFKYPLDWEIRFDVEDENEPRFLVLGNKRKNENRADEILINLSSGATKYMLKRDLPGGNIIMTESKNEEVLKVFEGIINTFKIGNYNLDCTNEPENFQAKYSWYNHFKEQIIKGWSLNTVCYNSQLNKVAYLKSKIDWENYKYDPNKSSYGLSQLGIYNIAKDEYNKAPVKDLGFYEGCNIIKEWKRSNEIIYECGAGDAGFGSSWTYSYNSETKKVTLIEECTIEAGRDPEEICVEK